MLVNADILVTRKNFIRTLLILNNSPKQICQSSTSKKNLVFHIAPAIYRRKTLK